MLGLQALPSQHCRASAFLGNLINPYTDGVTTGLQRLNPLEVLKSCGSFQTEHV